MECVDVGHQTVFPEQTQEFVTINERLIAELGKNNCRIQIQALTAIGPHWQFKHKSKPETQRPLALTLTIILIGVDIFNQFNCGGAIPTIYINVSK